MPYFRTIPAHIQSLFQELHGKELVYITKENKKITQSDLDGRQSRLRLPASSESVMQQDLLTLPQQAAANFLPQEEMESLAEINFLIEEDIKSAMRLKGVNVEVFVFSPGEPMRPGQGKLTKWNCGSIVIHGGNAMRAWSHLNKGDLVELWGFKDEENKLYFAIDKL